MSSTASKIITTIQEGMIDSIKQIVPIQTDSVDSTFVSKNISLNFAVLVGLTGDIKGKILYKGELSLFGSVGEIMFGMKIEGDMLKSFAGELGNMISGGLCTNLSSKGIVIDITSPTILEGSSTISGFKEAVEIEVYFQNGEKLSIVVMID
ncbi:chemotaxis protein CheX [Metabacillus litoralis]|uniref:chemotaxis protein CheX n=1 Tax=Metabacillus litoralis TaxID=152268 RepID=UPI001CFCC221|nr:chemotaxis protein CheX [Metabacillus litoralis]